MILVGPRVARILDARSVNAVQRELLGSLLPADRVLLPSFRPLSFLSI